MENTNDDSPNWGECFYDHFEHYLGAPAGRNVFERGPHGTFIQIIHYANVFGGCKAFCSFGLSHFAHQIGTVAEVVTPVDAGWDDVPEIIAVVLYHLVEQHMRLGRGQAIRFAKLFPDFAKKYNKAALFFSVPYEVPEEFNTVRCGSALGEIYLGVFISDTEYTFLQEQGTLRFEQHLESMNVDVMQLSRASSI